MGQVGCPALPLGSWNPCGFALRPLGVSSHTVFLYFSKANKSGLVPHLPGLAGNPFLVNVFLGGAVVKDSFSPPWECKETLASVQQD